MLTMLAYNAAYLLLVRTIQTNLTPALVACYKEGEDPIDMLRVRLRQVDGVPLQILKTKERTSDAKGESNLHSSLVDKRRDL